MYVSIIVFNHLWRPLCHMSYTLWRQMYFNKSMHLPIKVCPFWRPFQHIIQLYSQSALSLFVTMCLYSLLCHEGKWEEWRRTIHLPPSDSLIYLWSNWWQRICPWESPGRLNLRYNYKSKKITPPPQMHLRHMYVWETTHQWCFLYWKLFLLNSWKMFRKLTITKIDFNNIASATLSKSFSGMDTFLRINKEFRNNFLEEHLQQATSGAFQHNKIKDFELKFKIIIFWEQLAERFLSL